MQQKISKAKTIKILLFAFVLFAAGTTKARLSTNTPATYPNSLLSLKGFMMQVSPGDTTYRIIPSEGNTYGYDISINNKLLIHQPNIPGMSGNKGFEKKSDAEKVARLVIKKLQQGMMPPTVEKKELDSLKIKF
ncbi:DUF4907 domain-containing protein [Ginsengibacter hankyongi]|uniref:DUF4907 domain-containing protein n=1 Tax=Ginsengibacter hankyongi TaxID=2607284 RepID=A0A5J5IHH7_9BACT|nr:DUF4907 domain-containing protein [Ginsengibacter hankyongi]KAA9037212.1 DUF4907 domain-containing protein [Ginsengibacter hankyongi]